VPVTVISSLEDLQALVGQEVAVSDWFTVSQELIDAFARLTGDHQWIHVETARAERDSPYGTTIAHGFLTLSLVSRLHADAVRTENGIARVINYGLNRVRFPAPVLAGSRIRTRSVLQAFEEIADAFQLTWQMTVEVEGQSRPALVADWLVRLYRD
jgi:acyl dehydratase